MMRQHIVDSNFTELNLIMPMKGNCRRSIVCYVVTLMEPREEMASVEDSLV